MVTAAAVDDASDLVVTTNRAVRARFPHAETYRKCCFRAVAIDGRRYEWKVLKEYANKCHYVG